VYTKVLDNITVFEGVYTYIVLYATIVCVCVCVFVGWFRLKLENVVESYCVNNRDGPTSCKSFPSYIYIYIPRDRVNRYLYCYSSKYVYTYCFVCSLAENTKDEYTTQLLWTILKLKNERKKKKWYTIVCCMSSKSHYVRFLQIPTAQHEEKYFI